VLTKMAAAPSMGYSGAGAAGSVGSTGTGGLQSREPNRPQDPTEYLQDMVRCPACVTSVLRL
jgi:hypothetical protein